MDRETITAESLLRDIYEADSALRWFEQKYGLLSETFYRVYQQGQLRDEDLDEIQEYMEWSGWYEISQDRRQRYEQAADFLSGRATIQSHTVAAYTTSPNRHPEGCGAIPPNVTTR